MLNKKNLLHSENKGLSFEVSYQRMGSTITFIDDCDYNGLVCCDIGFGYIDDSGYHITTNNNTAAVCSNWYKGYALTSAYYGANTGSDEGDEYVIFDARLNKKYYGASGTACFPIGNIGACFITDTNKFTCIFPGYSGTCYSTDVSLNSDNTFTIGSTNGISNMSNVYYNKYLNQIFSSIPFSEHIYSVGTVITSNGDSIPDVSNWYNFSYSSGIYENNLPLCVSNMFYGFFEYRYNPRLCDIDDSNKIIMFSADRRQYSSGGAFENIKVNDNKIHYTFDGINYETLDYELPTTEMHYKWIKDSFWITGYEDYLYRVKVKGL